MKQSSDSENDEGSALRDSEIHFQICPANKSSLKTVSMAPNDSCFYDSDEDEEALLTVRGIENLKGGGVPIDQPLQLQFIPKRSHSTVSRVNDETDQWGADELAVQEEYALSLVDPQLKDTLMSRLNTFRKNRELCDVVLFVKEHEILAHKLVLASISPALFDMFLNESETEESTPNNDSIPDILKGKKPSPQSSQPSPVALCSITAGPSTKQLAFFEFDQGDFDCFEAIVNFAYTSRLQIGSKKVADLYKTAYCLQVFPVANACARFLADHLTFNNCIGIRKQANFNNDAFLVDKVDSFIAASFEKVIADSLEFRQLPCIKIRVIVEEVKREEHTGGYLADKCLQYFRKHPRLVERLEQQKENEKSHLLFMGEDAQLQDCCDMEDSSSVGSCEVVQDYKRSGKNTKRSKNAVGYSAVQHRVTGAMAVRMNASRVSNAKYASNESLNSLASSVSTDDEIESRLIAFNYISRFWTALAVLNRRLTVFSIQLSENDDFVSRENSVQRQLSNQAMISNEHDNTSTPRPSNPDSTHSSIRSTPERQLSNGQNHISHAFEAHQAQDLAPQTLTNQLKVNQSSVLGQKKVALKSMSQPRCAIGSVFVGGKIIVFGGYNRGECLKTVEEYDILNDTWRSLPNMTTERGRFDSAVVNCKVYAIAGSNGNNDLKACEVYDPKLEEWTPIKALNKARSHNGCAVIESMIYCMGGSSDQVVLRDCERYDPQADEWEPIAPMNTARFQSGCTSWKGLVVCCGGTDKWSCLDSVEAYDPRTNSWRMLNKLSTPRRGCAVAVIRDCLYVIGGHDGTQSLASVEVLENPHASWRQGPSLNTPRANTHAVVTASNSIYVIGGFNNGNQFLASIEMMDNEALGWRNWQQAAIPEEVNVDAGDGLSGTKAQLDSSSSTHTLKAANSNNSIKVGS